MVPEPPKTRPHISLYVQWRVRLVVLWKEQNTGILEIVYVEHLRKQ